MPGMVWTTPTVLLDSGANAECQPEWLVQFALMGSTYFRHRYGAAQPRVGLLSIGEESMKGNTLVKAAHELLAAEPAVNFIGNVEGRDMLTDDVDVVVTDGFTGNVVLKTLEGCGTAVVPCVRRTPSRPPTSYREASGVLSPVLDPLLVSIDYETYGGAMLLGVDGVCIIAHGSSQARAVSNAIVLAQEMADEAVVGELRVGRHAVVEPDLVGAVPRRRPRIPRPFATRGAAVPAETHVEQGPIEREEVFGIVRDRLADILEIDPSSISEGQSFVDDLEADSLALIELVEALEEELGERSVGFRIEDEDLQDLKTVRDAVDYVYDKVK